MSKISSSPCSVPVSSPLRHANGRGYGLCAAVFVLALTCIPASTSAQSRAEAPDTIAARLQACAACHGNDGEGTTNEDFPRLAGKPAEYLMHQLVAFRDGRRSYLPMNYLLEYQNDAFLHQVADYYASRHPALRPQVQSDISPATLQRGRSIATEGIQAAGSFACAACHGARFTGMQPAIPGLIGLRASYISAQLGAWRYGTRTAAAPDCMQVVAAALTEADTTAVAAWLAAQPIPPDPAPMEQHAVKIATRCGSEPQ